MHSDNIRVEVISEYKNGDTMEVSLKSTMYSRHQAITVTVEKSSQGIIYTLILLHKQFLSTMCLLAGCDQPPAQKQKMERWIATDTSE